MIVLDKVNVVKLRTVLDSLNSMIKITFERKKLIL